MEKVLPENPADSLKTKDLPLAAFLSARGCRLLRVDRTGQVCWFTFKAEELPRLLEEFKANGPVRVLDFAGCLRQLKGLVHSDLSGGGYSPRD